MAIAKDLPADTADQMSLPTCTGVWRLLVSPRPSWPELFRPHAQRVPSGRIASVKSSPAATTRKPSQDTSASVTAVDAIVPMALFTVQFWVDGLLLIVTLYAAPLTNWVE